MQHSNLKIIPTANQKNRSRQGIQTVQETTNYKFGPVLPGFRFFPVHSSLCYNDKRLSNLTSKILSYSSIGRMLKPPPVNPWTSISWL